MPVSIRNSHFAFLLDTGSHYTIIDLKYRDLFDNEPLGEVLINKKIRGLKLRCSNLSVGPYPVTLDSVVAIDLEAHRRDLGIQFHGVIGMDWLRDHIMEINFDNSTISFPEKLVNRPPPILDPHALSLTSTDGRPSVNITIPGIGSEAFLVDTGFLGAARVRPTLLDEIAKSGKGSDLGMMVYKNASRGGLRYGVLNEIQFANKPVNRIYVSVCTSTQDSQKIGLCLLSRYNLVFDFRNNIFYASPNKNFKNGYTLDKSGLILLRIDERTFVVDVAIGSPSDTCGIEPGDEILEINETRADNLGLFEISRMFAAKSDRFILRIRRRGRVFAKVLQITEDAYPFRWTK